MGKWLFLKQFCLYVLHFIVCHVCILRIHTKKCETQTCILVSSPRERIILCSWKPAPSSLSVLQAREASNGFDAQTEHTLGLQAASWKFAADDKSSEIKMLFMSSLLCLCLGGWPELSRNTPRTHTHPCVHHSMNLASTHVSRRSYRCHFTALINTKPLRPSQIITYTTQSWL